MKTQLHHKQISLLVLSAVLSLMSYWIPLPPESQMLNPKLPEATVKSIPTESVSSDREPATTGRFPVTAKIPQPVNHSDNLVTQPDDSTKSTKHLIDLPELSNDERNRLNHSKLVPITDKDRNLKH